MLPGLGGEFGNEYLGLHARNWSDDDNPRSILTLTLLDVWVLQAQSVRNLNVCSWVPVDHDPAPPMVTQFFRDTGAVPLAMSRFGEERLEEFNPIYVPHGCDTNAYRPYSREEVRKEFGLPEDAFIVGMVAANKGRTPPRKGFQQAFEAFRYFREKHENAYLYLHTGMNPNWSQGEDLSAMLGSLQIPTEAILLANQYRIHFAPPSAPTMAKLYSSFDCLLQPSMGEGFGLPTLEAQACGVPVICTDFSAMKEVVGAGWHVSGRPFWSPQKSWQAVADVGEIIGALEECESMSDAKRESLSVQARQHAERYDADLVMEEHFLPALEEVADRLLPKAPSVPAKVIA